MRLARRETGAVAVEFIMAVVPFMLLMSGVVQLAMISVAKLAVHYAAACAARAAIVVLPKEEEMSRDAGNERIREAAMVALLPVASSGQPTSSLANAFAKGGGWAELSKTTGVLLEQRRLSAGGHDAQITTRVVFAYHCTVPLASLFFCSPPGELPEAAQHDLSAAGVKPGPGRYLALRAEHTLTKQGRPNPLVNPERPF